MAYFVGKLILARRDGSVGWLRTGSCVWHGWTYLLGGRFAQLWLHSSLYVLRHTSWRICTPLLVEFILPMMRTLNFLLHLYLCSSLTLSCWWFPESERNSLEIRDEVGWLPAGCPLLAFGWGTGYHCLTDRPTRSSKPMPLYSSAKQEEYDQDSR